ncbi:unnamed protein product, partial [Rotaria magnacalcarata]
SASAAVPTTSQPLTFGTGLQNSSTIRPFGSTTTFGSTPASATQATGATGEKKTMDDKIHHSNIYVGFGGTSLFGSTQPAA